MALEYHFLPHFLTSPESLLYALVLLVVSLVLIFAGKSAIKALAFLVVGLAGAAFGAAAGTLVLGPIGTVLGAVIGFVIGGVIGLLLVHVGIGLALGYFGYLVTRDLTHIWLLAVTVGIVLFVAGVVITSKVLELATAVLGGVILYGVLTYFGVPPLFALIVAVVATIAGYFVQRNNSERRHQVQVRTVSV
jgi:hypothetical protein